MKHQLSFSAVIFDMDGLMFNTELIAKIAWFQTFEKLDYKISDDDYLKIVGRNSSDIKRLLSEILGNDFPYEKSAQLQRQYFDDYVDMNGIELKAGLLELLDYLEKNSIPKAVASSSDKEKVLKRLNITNVLNRFDAIICGDEIQNGKPAPEIFLKTAARLNVAPEKCIVLEDSDAGVMAAHNAGMIPLIIPDLTPPDAEVVKLAYGVYKSLHEVKSLLNNSVGN